MLVLMSPVVGLIDKPAGVLNVPPVAPVTVGVTVPLFWQAVILAILAVLLGFTVTIVLAVLPVQPLAVGVTVYVTVPLPVRF